MTKETHNAKKLIAQAAAEAKKIIADAARDARLVVKSNEIVDVAVMASQIADIKSDVQDIKRNLTTEYLKKESFDPVRKLVYGLVGIILTGVIAAILALIIQRP